MSFPCLVCPNFLFNFIPFHFFLYNFSLLFFLFCPNPLFETFKQGLCNLADFFVSYKNKVIKKQNHCIFQVVKENCMILSLWVNPCLSTAFNKSLIVVLSCKKLCPYKGKEKNKTTTAIEAWKAAKIIQYGRKTKASVENFQYVIIVCMWVIEGNTSHTILHLSWSAFAENIQLHTITYVYILIPWFF